MAFRSKRKTFDIIVENLPLSVDQKEVSRRLTSLGEIQSIFVRTDNKRKTNFAIVKFLCEPDASKAVLEYNKQVWAGNVVSIRHCNGKAPPEKWNENRPKSTPKAPIIPNMPGRFIMQQNFTQNAPHHQGNYQLRPMISNPLVMPNYNVPPPISKELHILCTVVISSVSFYCQLMERRASYEDLNSQMQHMCLSLKRLNHSPDFGKVYAVISGDGLWYRCQIKTLISHSQFIVHFIDHGNSEEVELGQLAELPDTFPLSTLIPIAVKCELVNISPNVTRNHDCAREALEFLEGNLVGQFLTITTISPKESPVYKVTKCIWKNQDVAEMLVKKLFAHPKPQSNKNILNSHSICTDPPKKALLPHPPMLLPPNPNVGSRSDTCLNMKSPIRILARPPAETGPELTKLKASNSSLEKNVQLLKKKCEGFEKELASKESILATCNSFTKLDSIGNLLQLVNSIRCNPSYDGEDLINDAFSLLKNSSDKSASCDFRNRIEAAIQSYEDSLRGIHQCEVKEQLSELVEKKTNCYNVLSDYMQQYISQTKGESTAPTLKEMSLKLKEKEKSSCDIRLNKQPSDLEELHREYNTQKTLRDTALTKARQQTNSSHSAFLESLRNLQMSFPLSTMSENGIVTVCPPFIPLEESLKAFDSSKSYLLESLDAEVNSLYGFANQEPNNNVISLLLYEIQKSLVQNKKMSQTTDKLKSLLNMGIVDNSELTSEIIELRKQIKVVKSKLRHTLVDKQDLEEIDHQDDTVIEENNALIAELQAELHQLFVDEDRCMKVLIKSFETTSPELDLEYPELGLAKYSTCQGIWKQGWGVEHFSVEPLSNCLGTCYLSQFLSSPVVLKEFLLDSEIKCNQLIQKVLQWKNLKSDHVVDVLAMFQKNCIQMCVMTARLPRLDESKEKATVGQQCALLVSVLEVLKILHSKNIAHGGMHPTSILLNQGRICLDFTFNVKNLSLDDSITFQAPELSKGSDPTTASDMFAFGSLVLLMLFPHLKFKNSKPSLESVVKNYKSSIEEHLSSSDYLIIQSLVNEDCKKRPTSQHLLKTNFLKNIRPNAKNKPAPVPEYHPDVSIHNPVDSMLNRMCSLRQPLNSIGSSVIQSDLTT